METEARVRAFERYFAKVQPPIASSPDASEVMEALVKNNYLTTICDEAFGPMYNARGYTTRAAMEAAQTEYYWMDEANNSAPDSPLCASLMALLGPNGSLFSIVEQTSAPSRGFNAMLKGMWRGATSSGASPSKEATFAPDTTNAQSFRFTMLLPLPSLCDFSKDVLNENPDHDLSLLPRERVMPLLLLPFWDPPIDLRTVVGAHPKRDSLRTTMLAYFFFRMLSFMNTRCAHHGRAIISPPLPSASATLSTWFDFCKKIVLGKEITKRPSTSFHFYQKLLVAHMENFVTSSLVSRFNTRNYAQYSLNVGWSEKDISSLIMLQGPAAMWLHRSNKPLSECDRAPITDPNALALAAQSLWMLEASFVRLESEVDGKGILADTSDYGSAASSDLMLPLRTCYRSCLIAVRTMALSLPYVQCNDKVFYDLLRLWRAIITSPVDADSHGMSAYFFHHYEAYSVLLVEILEMSQLRSFVEVASADTISTLRKALDELTFDPIPTMIRSVTDLVSTNGKELERIRKWNVLDWSRTDGLPIPVIAPLGEEARNGAARVYLRFAAQIESLKSTATTTTAGAASLNSSKIAALESTIATLKKIFVSLEADAAMVKAQPSPLRNRKVSSLPSSPVGINRLSTEEFGPSNLSDDNTLESVPTRYHSLSAIAGRTERRGQRHVQTLTQADRNDYVSGKRNMLDFTLSSDLNFGSGVSAKSYNVLRSHEIPILIPVVRFLDTVIDFVQYSVYTRKSYHCPKKHVLSVVGDARYRCCQHSMSRASFECQICRVGYCEACVGPVCMGDGQHLRACQPLRENKACCDRCGLVFNSDTSVAYSVRSRGGRVWCAGCVSRPWDPISVRFIASRNTYLLLLTVVLFYGILSMLVSLLSESEMGETNGFDSYEYSS